MSEIRYDERRPRTGVVFLDCSSWTLGKLTQLAQQHRVRLVDVADFFVIGGTIATSIVYVATVPNLRFEVDARAVYPDEWDLRFRNIRP